MHRLVLWQALVIYFLFISPVNSFASDIVINEIFANPENEDDEFVELYNNSEEDIDLNNWKISDLVKDYIITDKKIEGRKFLVFEKKNLEGFIALNNSNEEISLIDKEDNKVDSFSYEDTIEGRSWSRAPDGIGSFSNNTDVTKGSQNSDPPTPTPTITPSPTPTPKPTKVPTSTKSPTVTIISISMDEDNDANNVSSTGESVDLVSTPKEVEVKGSSSNRENDQEIENSLNNDQPQDYVYSITTGIGMLILVCVILLYRKFKNNDEEDDF